MWFIVAFLHRIYSFHLKTVLKKNILKTLWKFGFIQYSFLLHNTQKQFGKLSPTSGPGVRVHKHTNSQKELTVYGSCCCCWCCLWLTVDCCVKRTVRSNVWWWRRLLAVTALTSYATRCEARTRPPVLVPAPVRAWPEDIAPSQSTPTHLYHSLLLRADLDRIWRHCSSWRSLQCRRVAGRGALLIAETSAGFIV